MSLTAQNSKATDALVAVLRARSVGLPAEASEAASLLAKYASEIEHPARADEALKNFNAFAQNYKGLRDLLVPGVTEGEWFTFVEEVRGLSKAAMRTRGIDQTLIGRVHAFFNARGNG